MKAICKKLRKATLAFDRSIGLHHLACQARQVLSCMFYPEGLTDTYRLIVNPLLSLSNSLSPRTPHFKIYAFSFFVKFRHPGWLMLLLRPNVFMFLSFSSVPLLLGSTKFMFLISQALMNPILNSSDTAEITEP